MKRLIHAITVNTLLILTTLALIAFTTSAQSVGTQKAARTEVEKKASGSVKAPLLFTQKFEKEGVQVSVSISSLPDEKGYNNGLLSGANAVVSFILKDARTGQPLTGLHPAAWFNANESGRATNEAECKDKIRTFTGGLLSTRADIDLNAYLMLTLNHDNTITFINPQISFSMTKLESIIQLPGNGMDWTLSQNKDFLYVTLPEQSSVAVINTITKKLVTTLSTGEKTKPTRITLDPGGRYAWIGLDGSPAVAALDTASNKIAASIPVGAGLHNIAFNADSRFAYVTNSEANTVSVIDTKSLTKVADIKVGKTPVPVAYSSASRMIYVAALNDETISVIDPAKQQVVATIPVKRGVVALRFEPGGRFGFAVNQVESTVSILDAATNTITSAPTVVKEPDQVVFTSGYAYIRGISSEKVSLLDLSQASNGKISPVEITAGRLAPSNVPEEIGLSDMIAPTPEGNAVMIANTPDQMIYYYVEGMMAPMGTLTNYKRRPHALLLLDRSLSEKEPGVYAAPIKLPKAGHFDIPFLLDQPRLINCFQMDVAPSPDEKESPQSLIAVEYLFKGKRFKPTDVNSLKIRLTDSKTRQPIAGLTDVQILVFEPPGIWQERQFAKEVEPGVYEITQAFPHTGLFRIMLRISSRGVTYADLPYVSIPVDNNAQPEQQNAHSRKRGVQS